MALSIATGQISITNSTGNKSYTGVGFQGKAIILFGNRMDLNTFQANMQGFIGFATSSTARFALALAGDDNQTTIQEGRTGSETQVIRQIADATSPSIGLQADFVSFDADGFTINVTTAPGFTAICNYIVLGGTDITSVKVGAVDLATSGATQSFTDPGFQPDFLVLAHNGQTTWGNAATAKLGLGFASSSSDQGAIVIGSQDLQADSDSHKWQKTGAILLNSDDTTAVDAEAALSSFDATGFTLSVSDLPASAVRVGYLAVKGGTWKVGAETQATSATTKDTSLSFTPRGAIFAGANATANASFDNTDCRLTIGASDGTNNTAAWMQSVDGLTSSDDNKAMSNTKAILHYSSPNTTDAVASATMAASKFTLDWSTADATARQFIYAAAGDTTVAAAKHPYVIGSLL